MWYFLRRAQFFFSTETTHESRLNASRFGVSVPCKAAPKDGPTVSKDRGSSICCPTPASSIKAKSSTLRVIGPSTQRVSNAGSRVLLGARQEIGRNPIIPLNVAGVRRMLPSSLLVASQTNPLASPADAHQTNHWYFWTNPMDCVLVH